VSSPLGRVDRVDGNVARAQRAVARSKKIIVAAKEDLETHQRWLHRHRMLWSEDLERHQRLIKRQRAICAYKQIATILLVPLICRALFRGAIWVLICFRDLLSFSFSWIFAKARVSFARVRVMADALGLSLKEVIQPRRSPSPVRLSFAETVLEGADKGVHANHGDDKRKRETTIGRLGGKGPNLQDRIHRPDNLYSQHLSSRSLARGLSSGVRRSQQNRCAHQFFDDNGVHQRELAQNARHLAAMRESCSESPSRTGGEYRSAHPALSRQPRLIEHRLLGPALGFLTVTLVAAGAVHAIMLPSPPEVTVVQEVAKSTRLAAALSPTRVSTAPPKIPKPAPSPIAAPGFRILVTTAVPEPLPPSPENIASMMLMTSPLAIAPTELRATTPAPVVAPLAVKPKLSPKLKFVRQEPPEQLPWLRPPKRKFVRQEPPEQLPWLRPLWWQRLPWIRVR
jgi:hypothetical protein